MPGNLQPLDQKFPIVTSDGKPTLYFIKWAQQKQIDISEAITAEQALAIIEQYLADHQLQEGSGISISPSGNLSDAPTIAAEVQAILDQITTTRGSVLYRGASGWSALAPGTSGQFLKTNGAGADPEWAAGGGGGAWQLIDRYNFSVDGAGVFTVDVQGYSDLLILGRAVTLASSGFRGVFLSVDGGSSYYVTSGDYVTINVSGTETGDYIILNHGTATTAARDFGGWLFATDQNDCPKPGQFVINYAPSRWFVGSLSPVTHLKICGRASSGGTDINMTGGNVWVFGR